MSGDEDDLRFLQHFYTLKTMIKDGEEDIIVDYMKRHDVTADRFKRDVVTGGRYFSCPVCMAAKSGRLGIMNALISMGFSYEYGSPDDLGLNLTPIHLACYGGHLEIVQSLIGDYDVDVESRDCYDNTPLYWAINKSDINLDIVKYLIDKGAEVNDRNRIDHSTLLHGSVRRFGNQDVCECLLSHGADITARDHQGNTALHDVALWAYEGSARVMLDAGAEVDARSRSDDTPFLVAAKYDNLAMMKIFHSYGADPEVYNKDKMTALHFAVTRHSYNTAYYLSVELNVDPDTSNKENVTPFGLAVRHGDVNIATLLINSGSRPKNTYHRTGTDDISVNFDAGVTDTKKEAMVIFVKKVISRSRSLQDLCIFKVRRFLGRRLSSAVDFLPLPVVIRDLIKLSHLYDLSLM